MHIPDPHLRLVSTTALMSLALGIGSPLDPHAALAQTPPEIERSHVVFTAPKYDDSYERYGADMVAWGFMPPSWGDLDPAAHANAVSLAQGAGLTFQSRIEWDVVWAGMQSFSPDYADAAVRDFDGGTLAFPWNPGAFWFCSHQPLFDDYTHFQIADVALAADPEFILLDSQTATPITYWYGGCFCDRCIAEFTEWLELRYTATELAALGIPDVSTFDYHDHLVASGYNRASYESQAKIWPNAIPLSHDYRLFQQRWLNDYIQGLIAFAAANATGEIAVSTSSPILDPYFAGTRMVHVPEVDFFTQEFPHEAETGAVPFDVIAAYKIADVLGRRLLLTAQPDPDWAIMVHENRVDLARSWIAQAYAYGANFMVPLEMWAVDGLGSYWYQAAPEDYEYLYKFIDENAALFDDYEAVAHVGVLYVHTAYRYFSQQLYQAVAGLTLENIPFRLVVAGDEWWPRYLDAGELAALDAVVTTTDAAALDAVQAATLAAVSAKTALWPDVESLVQILPREIATTGSGVSVVPRANPGVADAPFIVHLVNRNYTAATDTMETQSNFDVTLLDSLFGSRAQAARYHRPGQAPVDLTINAGIEAATFTVPGLEHWGIVELTPSSSPEPPCSATVGYDQCRLKPRVRSTVVGKDRLTLSCKILDTAAVVGGVDPTIEQTVFRIDDADGLCLTVELSPGDCVANSGGYNCKSPKTLSPYRKMKLRRDKSIPENFRLKFKIKNALLACLDEVASPWSIRMDFADDCGRVECPSDAKKIECP